MKQVKRQLASTAAELAEGLELIEEKKDDLKKARSKLAKRNAKRSIHTIKNAVKDIARHRKNLKALDGKLP
jgi:DNA repair exonuclease SbcCD ATPase subunit